MSLTVNFQDGRFHDDQKHRLGLVEQDENGDKWSYVQLAEAVAIGDVVRDSHGGDLLSSSPGSPSEAIAQHATKLIDSGEFGAADDAKLVGAIGMMIEDTTGHAHAFKVVSVDDANTLTIESLMSPTRLATGGWHRALTTSDDYVLYMPGLVKKVTVASHDFVRGVAQQVGVKNQYGWVRQTGMGTVKVDADKQALATGEWLGVIETASGVAGRAEGFNTASGGHEAWDAIGRVLFGDAVGTTDHLHYVYLTINNEILSYRYADDDVAFNKVTVG